MFRSMLLPGFAAVLLTTSCRTPVKVVDAYTGPPLNDAQLCRLHLPAEVQLVQLNDVRFAGMLEMFRQPTVYRLHPGEYTMMVRYTDIFDLGQDNYERISSQPVPLTFSGVAGADISVKFERPKSLISARRFAARPEFTIAD